VSDAEYGVAPATSKKARNRFQVLMTGVTVSTVHSHTEKPDFSGDLAAL
jgi:hypothetical protein